jgi:hypothetical protein
MKALDLKTQNKPPALMLYGPAGTGKTALVSQAAGGYMFDFDRGMRTALTLQDPFTTLRQRIEFDTYVDDEPLKPSAWLRAKQKMQLLVPQINAHYPSLSMRADGYADTIPPAKSGPPPYDAVAVDSLTGAARAIRNHVMSLSGGGVFNVPQIQHYGMFVNEANQFLTMLRSLRCLVLVTAHEMLVEDGNMVLIRMMSVTRQHGMNEIPWQFDEVLHTRVAPLGQGRYSYIVSGAPSTTIMTRTRSGLTTDLAVNDIGLAGLLAKVGYTYGAK